MSFNEKISTILSVELFERMVNGLENRINHHNFKNDLKYNLQDINNSMEKDFTDIVNLLQKIVDKFYYSKYDINGFIPFNLSDVDFCIEHNLMLVRNCKKLIKFAS